MKIYRIRNTKTGKYISKSRYGGDTDKLKSARLWSQLSHARMTLLRYSRTPSWINNYEVIESEAVENIISVTSAVDVVEDSKKRRWEREQLEMKRQVEADRKRRLDQFLKLREEFEPKTGE